MEENTSPPTSEHPKEQLPATSDHTFSRGLLLGFVGILMAVGLGVAIYLVQKPQDPRSQAKIPENISPVPKRLDHEDLPPPPYGAENPELSSKSASTLGAESPIVRFEKPTNNTSFSLYTTFNIVVQASHVSGIKSITVYNGNDELKTCSASSCNFWTNLGNKAGSYTIRAVARANDSMANTAETSIIVTKGSATPVTSIPTNTPFVPLPTSTPRPTVFIPTTVPPTANPTESTLPLTITVPRPLPNAQFPSYFSGVRVDATVTPAGNVGRIQIYGNGNLLVSCPVPSCGTYWLMNKVANGINTVRIVATDKITGKTYEKNLTFIKTTTALPTVIPTATATPIPTNVPRTTIVIQPTATPIPPSQFEIVGTDAYYKASILASLDLIQRSSPEDYAIVAQYVRHIEQSNGNWYLGGYNIAISTGSTQNSIAWAASSIVHEATHSKNAHTGQIYIGCEGEAASLRAQARFLVKIREYQFAQYVGSLIGNWPPGADCSYCKQTTCKANSY